MTEMLFDSDNILHGPKGDITIPEESIGRYFLNCLKQRDAGHTLMIDYQSGITFANGQVLQNSMRASKVLRGLGVTKGDVVTIVAENTLMYILPQLGCLYLGATVNPLNPHYSIRELKHAIDITKPKVILCANASLSKVAEVSGELQLPNTRILLLENENGNRDNVISFVDLLQMAPHIDVNTFSAADVNCISDGACIFMSSGTTGLPKGVFLTHNNLRTAINCISDGQYYGVDDKDGTIFILPVFHVLGLLLQIMSVCFGLKLVFLNKFKPVAFLDSIQKYKPTRLFIVPPLLLFLAKSPMIDQYDVTSIKDVIVGGASIAKDIQIEAMERLKGTTIRIIYGMTEASSATTIQQFNRIVLGSVGVLIPHISLKVWDPVSKQSLGPQQLGELCFKGPMVMTGYYGNKRSTQECIDEQGFYHSGDVGYYDKDGNIFVVDRIKDIIKYKGFQVSPAELEALILSHPAVKDSAVIGIPNDRTGEVPFAYVVKQIGATVTVEEIIEYVAENISPQKHIYGGVEFIEEIPKNASGKILRRKLIEKYFTSS